MRDDGLAKDREHGLGALVRQRSEARAAPGGENASPPRHTARSAARRGCATLRQREGKQHGARGKMSVTERLTAYHLARLKDKNPQVRQRSIQELALLEATDAIDALEAIYRTDPDPDVRKAGQ